MKYEPLLHVVLYQPEIPPNTGNIGRSCVAAAAKLWLIKPLSFDIDEKARRRAGLDYWEHLEWQLVENWDEMTQHIAPQLETGRVWFLSKKAKKSHVDVTYNQGDVLIFGSESAGIPSALLSQYSEQALRIPMRQEVRSLNLSSAAAIVMYEALRQLDFRGD
jgi:tRNA (cytidine/uridine-2'-O-)-methyltransferase